MTPRTPHRRLARRLLLGQVLVIAVGLLTLAGVAFVAGPPVFRHHVHEALGEVTPAVAAHLDEAFTTTVLLAGGLGVTAAIGAAMVVSLLLALRIARPVEALSGAAQRIAHGHLDARAPRHTHDDELADLTTSFNEMADALEHTEDQRRRLLADLAHELRTPLATFDAYLEGLQDGVVVADDAVPTLQEASGRLRRLVDDLTLVSRAEEGRLELELAPLDPAELARRALRASEIDAEHAGVGLHDRLPSTLPLVAGDDARLRQVLANLLDNALRHTPPGEAVTLSCDVHPHAVAIHVTDTGRGIPADALPHVFERFYRADPAREHHGGSGIGLTISRAIAHAHRGELTAHSDGPGRGARFTLQLPTADATSDRPAP
jgi:two-component system, OmpR family, sensor histidine kinase BaeS